MVHALPGVAEALNNPVALMLPHEVDHVTGWFAENCCVCPCAVTALTGVIAMGDVTVAVVDALDPLPLVAVAVITHEPGERGAVNRPADEIVPQEAVNVEAVLAVNCCVPPSLTVGFRGLIVTVGGVMES